MAKRKARYQAPFLEVHMACEGERIFHLKAQRPISPVARSFAAALQVHPGIRREATCCTLLEIAKSLLDDQPQIQRDLDEIISVLVLLDTPMITQLDQHENWPF